MNVKLKILLMVVALGFLAAPASADKARKYSFTLGTAATVAGQQLQQGNYDLIMHTHETKVRLRNANNGDEIEIEAKVEQAGNKFDASAVHLSNADGTARITEIRLGGSRTRLVFE